jgi:hypothetical protein
MLGNPTHKHFAQKAVFPAMGLFFGTEEVVVSFDI